MEKRKKTYEELLEKVKTLESELSKFELLKKTRSPSKSESFVPDYDDSLISSGKDISLKRQMEKQLRDKNKELLIAKERIDESEKKYRLIVENQNELIVQFNEKKEINYASPNYCKTFGVKEKDIIGKSFFPLIHEDDKAIVEQSLKNILKPPHTTYHEERDKTVNGWSWFAWSVKAVLDKNDNIKEIIGVGRNIDKQKGYQLELAKVIEKFEQSEETLKSIVENGTNLFYKHDVNHKLTFVSSQIKDILGYEPEEAMVIWTELATDNPINELGYEKTMKAIETGEKQGVYDLELKHKNGHNILIEAREVPIVKNGKTVEIVGALADVTERRRIESELRESEQKFKTIYDNAPVLINAFDDCSKCILWNKECEKTFGWTKEELNSVDNSLKLFYPDNEYYNKVLKTISEQPEREFKEWHPYTKWGTQLTVMWANFSIGDSMIINIGYDVTKQKRSEEALVAAKEKAEESDRLKSAFLANMSHEIRTPMNGIIGFTDLLKKPDLTGEQKDSYINIIKKSGNRMLDTVNDIIDISKIDSGQVEISNSTFDINNEIDEQYQFFKQEAFDKGLEFKLQNKLSYLHKLITTDKVKINSIVSNLIKNAIKYTDRGEIEIICEKKASNFVFEIKDTGIGIPKNRINYIFNRFEQADIADLHAKEGSGLGLSIAKAYAEMLKGKIDVKSVVGKGSVFSFSIPWNYETTEISSARSKEKANKKSFGKKLNILIVEDDDISFEHLKIIISHTAKNISRAFNGKEAIEFMKNNSDIELILMDIKIPLINGYDATREIRKFNKDVVIIAQTAYGLTSDRELAIKAGCDDYIAKPIDKDQLIEIVTKNTKNK